MNEQKQDKNWSQEKAGREKTGMEKGEAEKTISVFQNASQYLLWTVK